MKIFVLAALLALVPASVTASEIHFSASARETIPNTQMRLVFKAVAETQGGPERLPGLSARVDQILNRALGMIARQQALTAQTLGLASQRLYRENKPAGWQVSGEIAVSGPAGDLPALAGRLQAMGLAIESIGSAPSEKARQQAQARLIRAVLQRLQGRAELIASTLACRRWSFLRIDIGGVSPMPPAQLMSARLAATPAPLAAGRETLGLSARATMRCTAAPAKKGQ